MISENLHSDSKNHENTNNEIEFFEEEYIGLPLDELLTRLEGIINRPNAGAFSKEFNQLKKEILTQIQYETEDKKHSFVEKGGSEENFSWEHPYLAKVSGLSQIFKEKYEVYKKHEEQEHQENKQQRIEIIERLKNIYTNSDSETNLFKEIRLIKEAWSNAGKVAKNEFKLLNNNYFYHLEQFYTLLNLNKEFLEQEYAHNLEKRRHIIARAKELENEPSIQKVLNELQYLHKLWKEEAEPVAEEFRDSTWEEFKEISNQLHSRKEELSKQIEETQRQNLELKMKIITQIQELVDAGDRGGHTFWQNAILRVEEMRSEFLKLGSVPRKLSTKNWNEFKRVLKAFNTKKNDFYKNLKNSQVSNLEAKMKLIQIAKDNMNSEDWETSLPLFKKLQSDWKKIGHIPRSQTDKVWTEFQKACNTFFDNFRVKTNAISDNWKNNLRNKQVLIDELRTLGEGAFQRILEIFKEWNAIGKVPKDKISINKEFMALLKEKLTLNGKILSDLKEDGSSEDKLIDKARRLKNQILDLENEVTTLENNLSFFNNPSRENVLLKDTYIKIDEKKSLIEILKQELRDML